jgi:hypothetical protein
LLDGGGALKIFLSFSSGTSQPIEKARFARENPRKSKSIFRTGKPLSKELQAIPIGPAF